MAELFLSDHYLQGVRRRAQSGERPWAAAYERLLAAAEEGLTQPPLSVRQNGGSPYFRVDAVYVEGRDGVTDEQANRQSTALARRLGDVSRDLALAYRLSGEGRYADKALELIHAWCINQDTRMVPTGRVEDPWTPGGRYGGDVVMFAAFEKLFLTIYLLRSYPGWDLTAHAAVRRWVRAMLDPQRELMFFKGREMYNNWEDERLLYLAHGALAADDLDLLAYTFDRWRQTLPMKMTPQGELPRETMRTRSMQYTLMALQATTQIAEIARQFGVDLYDYTAEGRSLKLGIDFAAHYLLHMDQWPHPMIKPLSEEPLMGQRLGLFELAHNRWGEQRYLEVIDAYGGRPVTGGHATLLYARE